MDYQMFVNDLLREIEEQRTEGQEIKQITVPKNNGVMREALSFRPDGADYAAVIYLDSLYQQFPEDGSVPELAGRLLSAHIPTPWREEQLQRCLSDFELVRDRIYLRLINTEKNHEFLETAPSEPFMNLSLICCIILDAVRPNTLNEAAGSIRITDDLLLNWGIDSETLFLAARENTVRMEAPEFLPMSEIFTLPASDRAPELYVLSNQSRMYGATVMTYDNILEKIAGQLGGDFVLLPSSVHEMIVLPPDKLCAHEEALKMIREINEREVDPEEILSDCYYRYICSEKRLILCE
ncbi:MAG: DUF5688 family protein [Lachnospiraceae bacterium]|nr:DUF5688 family protein [Lachnospiraceae bacterium]